MDFLRALEHKLKVLESFLLKFLSSILFEMLLLTDTPCRVCLLHRLGIGNMDGQCREKQKRGFPVEFFLHTGGNSWIITSKLRHVKISLII